MPYLRCPNLLKFLAPLKYDYMNRILKATLLRAPDIEDLMSVRKIYMSLSLVFLNFCLALLLAILTILTIMSPNYSKLNQPEIRAFV